MSEIADVMTYYSREITGAAYATLAWLWIAITVVLALECDRLDEARRQRQRQRHEVHDREPGPTP